MRRNATLMTLVVLLAGTAVCHGQGRRQRDWMSRLTRAANPFGQLGSSKYLQKEMKLTPAQLKRMKEINLQMQGTQALLTSEVSDALKITDKQRKEIEEIQRSALSGLFSGFRDLFRQGGQPPNADDIRKKLEDARDKAEKKVYDVLTRSQRAKFEKMKGKPIDRKKLRGEDSRQKRPDV